MTREYRADIEMQIVARDKYSEAAKLGDCLFRPFNKATERMGNRRGILCVGSEHRAKPVDVRAYDGIEG